MSLPVITTPEADAQIRAIDTWWRTNRPAAQDLFAEELANCLALLEQAPAIGKPYRRHPSVLGLRRVLLRTSSRRILAELCVGGPSLRIASRARPPTQRDIDMPRVPDGTSAAVGAARRSKPLRGPVPRGMSAELGSRPSARTSNSPFSRCVGYKCPPCAGSPIHRK